MLISLSTASIRPASMAKEPTLFMTRAKVEPMPRREKERASISSIYLDLKPLYDVEVTMKPYRVGYITSQLQKFVGRRVNTRRDVVRPSILWELMLMMLICV